MAISAVSSVNFNTRNNRISFGNIGEGDEIRENTQPKRASNFVKVPVIVMMTLSPSLLNSAGAAAENYQDEMNFPQTEQLYAMATPEPQSTRTSSTPRRSSYVRPEVVQYQKNFTSDGKQYTMYYVFSGKEREPQSKNVNSVYLLPKGYSPRLSGISEEIPPRITKVIYHEPAGNTPFVGLVVEERKSDERWYKREIKVPDDIANGLMDLVKGRTQFKVPSTSSLSKMFAGANMEYSTSSTLIKEQITR